MRIFSVIFVIMILASAPTAYGRGGFNLTPIPFPIGPPPPPFSATLDNRYMFDSYMSYYLPTITNGSINLRVGMEKLVDKRPDKDRSVTEKIADVDAIVSARLLKDFQVDQVFAAIDSPDKKEDDLIMSGEIRRFYWKWSGSLISLIPPINLLTFFGLPRYHAKGIAEVYIRLVSFKTGRVLAEYDKISTKTESYTIYNESTADYCSGRELAAALKDVSNQIREAIVLDIEEGRLKIPE